MEWEQVNYKSNYKKIMLLFLIIYILLELFLKEPEFMKNSRSNVLLLFVFNAIIHEAIHLLAWYVLVNNKGKASLIFEWKILGFGMDLEGEYSKGTYLLTILSPVIFISIISFIVMKINVDFQEFCVALIRMNILLSTHDIYFARFIDDNFTSDVVFKKENEYLYIRSIKAQNIEIGV